MEFLALHNLLLPWRSFAQPGMPSLGCLSSSFSGNFQCPVCGCLIETIICDGTLVGFWKDLFPALLQEPDREFLLITHESKHSDCVFLRSVKGRELLMKYSGYSKDRKTLPSPKPNKKQTAVCALFCGRRTPKHFVTSSYPYSREQTPIPHHTLIGSFSQN